MIDTLNKKLSSVFRSLAFRVHLTSNVQYCPGTPIVEICEMPSGNYKLIIEFEKESTFYDNFDAQMSEQMPSETIKNICIDYLKTNNPDLYNSITQYM